MQTVSLETSLNLMTGGFEPTESWMMQIARNLVDPWTGFLTSSRLLIHDRATVFSEHFRQLLRLGQVEPLRLPARSPNLNAYAE
jgi:putative transposase